MSEYVDEISGLKFRKRTKPAITQAIQQTTAESFNNDDAFSTNSYSTVNTKKTNLTLDIARPSPHVPTTEYLQHIPSGWSTTEKLRQLLVWCAQKELEDEARIKTGKINVVDKVKVALIDKLKTSNSVISLYKRPDIDVTRERNAANVRNEKLLKEYLEDIAILKDETEQWNKCQDEIFDDHAVAMDKVAVLEANEYKVNQSVDFMDNIEPDQREYLVKLLDLESNPEIGEGISNMDAEVAQFRQTLYIATQFNQHSGKLADKTKSKLAHIFKENSRAVPIDADERTLGLFEDTEAKRKQDEIRNVEHVFRLFSQSNIHNTGMDLDE